MGFGVDTTHTAPDNHVLSESPSGKALRFNRLRLNGFKSFVDPTDLVVADGLTGVVGPNGCGKSNLLEALRWVMGENRPTAMRGGGMEDVIFAGASTRPARNFAEVSLHIDNSERLAPAGFNEGDTLEITRRITRDVGSAYKVNAKDVRARDVQMLFADASTGAHSPALVRQGQISELINARPKARRRILEEAAGISGLYQRRHEAELKLRGAETNLARVDDVVEQLASQLAQLARQARQAARYRALGDELRQVEGLLLYRRWHDAAEDELKMQEALRQHLTDAAALDRAARAAEASREEAEAKLPPVREEEAIASAVLQRLVVERDGLSERERQAARSIDTLQSRILQLTHDIERETALNKDAEDTIARLDWEAAELAKASEGFDTRLADADAQAREAATAMQAQEALLTELTEDTARLAARHQSTERLLADNLKTLETSQQAALRAQASAKAAQEALAAAENGFKLAETARSNAARQAELAETALVAADDARAEAQSREAEARATRSEGEGEASALGAEVAALSRLVNRDTAEGGQILDLLTVKSGFEKALGAALADDLRAPLITQPHQSGWAELPEYDDVSGFGPGVTPLSDVVTVPSALSRRIAHVGLVDAALGPTAQAALEPGQRLVSIEGDLWRWDGFRATADDAPSASALRLQQLNRLQELKQDLEAATARAEGAAQAHEVLKAELAKSIEADRAARETRREADKQMAEASRALSQAEADRNISAGKLESAQLAEARHDEDAKAAAEAAAQAKAALGDLADLEDARARVEAAKTQLDTARQTMLAKRAAFDETRREGEARTARRQEIAKESSGWRLRLENADKRIAELNSRKQTSEEELASARDLPTNLEEMRNQLVAKIAEAETRCKAASDALALAETALREAATAERDTARRAADARESRAAAQARADAARDTKQAAAQRIHDEQETTPEALLEQLATTAEALPPAQSAEADAARLRRQRDALGAVNLRAEEDAREVQQEHDLLVKEKSDLESAIAKLRTGISNLNREGRERLLTAFEQVNTNFAALFKHLFGGGEAKLVLVESDDPLEAGLEIMCQPPGKKLSTLSLLSGGEQTLTALALIFAVFQANPAPICVLDEVDAPLDDANVTRFCDLLDEMTRQTETRFLIITHHAVTMSRMDRLFGVTMAEQGVSQLVSVDLKGAEKMVA